MAPIRDRAPRRHVQNPQEAMSLLRGEDLLRFRRKFYFPNDVSLRLPTSAERVLTPPPGYIGVYETLLRAGLRFPPAPELLEILRAAGICISQLSYRAMAILTCLIVLFRGRGARLTPEILSRFGEFSSSPTDRIFFQGNGFIFIAKEMVRHWSVGFFFVKNTWGFDVKWGKPLKLPESLQLSMDGILQMLGFRDLRDLQLEIRDTVNFLTEERLRRVGISTDIQRAIATAGKKSQRTRSPSSSPLRKRSRDQVASSEPSRVLTAIPLRKTYPREEGKISSKKDRESMERKTPPQESREEGSLQIVEQHQQGEVTVQKKAPELTAKIRIPEYIIARTCTGYKQHEKWKQQRAALDAEYDLQMKEWNSEFVKIKYLQTKAQNTCDLKSTETGELAAELSVCRAELSEALTTLRVLQQSSDRTLGDLVESQTQLRESSNSMMTLRQRVSDLEEENQRLRSVTVTDSERIAADAVEAFRGSYEFRALVHDAVQAERDNIYQFDIVTLQSEALDEGLIRGFYKGIRAASRQRGTDIEGLTFSQASVDPAFSPGSGSDGDDGDEVVSGLLESQTVEEDVSVD